MSNEWWLPIPDAKKRAYEKVFESARRNHIDFCFAVHPQLSSPRPLDPRSETDFEQFWQHFAWAQSQGVKWFSVPLDDVHIGGGIRIDGAEHARFVNKLFARLRKKDPTAQLIFCPTWYWGDGTASEHRPYLEAVARDLHPDVYVFWTGPEVVPARISSKAAESFKSIVGHRVILWENYPVNDGSLGLHLGPVVGRDPDLGRVLDGYMSNPHFRENQINRLPLFTLAEYAFDPVGYDPLTSIGQAILHEGGTHAQRAVLKDLVELFPGRVPNTGHNAALAEYKRLSSAPHSRYIAALYLRHVEEVQNRLNREFPDRYAETKITLQKTLDQIRSEFKAQYEP
jgi:hyaluronoglucosaminidase